MTRSKKRCRICGKPKALTEFYRAKNNKDGHRSECKAFSRQVIRRAELRRIDEVRARKRKWYRIHRDYFKKYYVEHKEYFRRKKREYRSDMRKLAHMKAYNREWWRRKRERDRQMRREKE